MTVVDPMRPLLRRKAIHSKQTRKIPLPPIDDVPPKLVIKPKRRWWLPPGRYTLVALMIAALLVSPEIIGQILVIFYGLLAIIRQLALQLTFALAVVLLVLSPLFTWLTGSESNGAVLAGYSFMLLGVGLVQLIIGYRRMVRP